MNRYEGIVACLAISLDSVAIFVVGLYSPFIPFWLASGLVISLFALTFGGIVVLPGARKGRASVPDSVIQYLFVLVLTFGLVIRPLHCSSWALAYSLGYRSENTIGSPLRSRRGSRFSSSPSCSLLRPSVFCGANPGHGGRRCSDHWGRLRTEFTGTPCRRHSFQAVRVRCRGSLRILEGG